MLKIAKTLVVGTLAVGLLWGSGTLINPASASAATIKVNDQVIVSSQLLTNDRQQSANQPIANKDLNKPVVANQQTDQKQFIPRPDNDKLMLSRHYTQIYASNNYVYSSIVTQAADILNVPRQVIVNGLNNGKTLVQIAKRLGVTRSSTLNELQSLQYSLNANNMYLRPVGINQWQRPIDHQGSQIAHK
jgi:hypothetical protein